MASLTTESEADLTAASDRTTAAGLRVVELPFENLTDDFLARWCELESRAVEGNAFLSPHFVVPAVEHLADAYRQKPLILAVESADGAELLTIGLFEKASSSRLLPLTHLQSWRCEHTLFDGLLVDEQQGSEALVALFEWLSQQGRRWHGVAFTDRSADGELNRMLDNAAATVGATWFEDWTRERAVVPLSEVPEDCLQTLFSKSRRRNFRRSAKRLAERGDVSFSFLRDGNTNGDNIQAFLELEAMGWKGDEGTAFLSSTSQEQFCRDMTSRFAAAGHLIMCELSVDQTPIASSLNVRSSRDVFGFKIGWHPDFADASPGVLNELHFLQNCREQLSDVRLIDSCAKPGSYVEDVWPWKRRLTTGVFTTTRTGTLAAGAMSQLKRLKRMLKKV